MSHLKEIRLNSGKRVVLAYSGLSLEELEQKVDMTMISSGYTHVNRGFYTIGSKNKQFWLGAFAKYFEFKVTTDASNPDEILVGIYSPTDFLTSGGIIGQSKVKTELQRLRMQLEGI